MIDERTFWGWAVNGVGGAVRIAEMLVEESRPMHGEQLATLKGHAERLIELIGRMEEKVGKPE